MRSRILLFVAAGAVALGMALVFVQVSPQVRAGPPPPVTILDAEALRDSGRGLTLASRSIEGVVLVEPIPGGRVKNPRSLAAAPDGLALAVSTVDLGVIGPLTLARADGSQLEIALPGVRGAAFDPAGSWLAAVDLGGGLWRIEAASGAATRLADGPYAADLAVLPDGQVLAVRLSAVDAPLWASAETIDGSGAVTPLTGALAAEAQLVYAATPLADGATALVRHRLGGGVAIARLAADGAEKVLAELDGAASVDVSPDGTAFTWHGGGTTWLASMNRVGEAIAIGDGPRARFSPDGSLILVSGPDGAIIVDRSGSLIDAVGPGACWIGGGRGCRP